MVNIDDKFMSFAVGWIVEYKDGKCIYEGDMPWSKVPKKNIAALLLKWHEKMWSIRGKESYVQFKRDFVTFSASGQASESVLAERCIGYYDEQGRKVIYRVSELTGQMKLDVKEG